MLGRATFTIVSSSTSMSCAVAMTSRARPPVLAGGRLRVSSIGFRTDMVSRPSRRAGVPEVKGGVPRPPRLAEGGEQQRRELAEDGVQRLRARPVEQPGHVHRGVAPDAFGVDLGE